MSTQSVTPDRSQLPLAGKYDKRKQCTNLAKYNAEAKENAKYARKPLSRQQKAERRAVTYLKDIDAHKSPVQMFKDAIDARNYSLAWTIRCDVSDRAHGKPYIALNPEAITRQEPADISRIAVAINNLQIVSGEATRPGRKQLEAKREAQAIDAEVVSADVDTIPSDLRDHTEAGAKPGGGR